MGCSSSLDVQEKQSQPEQICKEAATFHESYQLGRMLGRGGFAQVRSAIRRTSQVGETDPMEVAVKIVDIRYKYLTGKPGSRSPIQKAHDEMECWTTMGRHSNIVDWYEGIWGRDLFYMVMETCPIDLYGHLAGIRELNERSLGVVFLQMLHAVAHVHSKKVVHRDIKLQNFLVGGKDGRTVKLCDFGLSVKLPENGEVEGVYGTTAYMCPEMLKRNKYDEKADIWSIGVATYVLLFGTFPYLADDRKKLKREILNGASPKFKPAAACADISQSNSVVSFVRSLLERDPRDRLSALQALQSDYLVAVERQTHVLEGNLPCLHRVLRSAKKFGAFAKVCSPTDDDICDILIGLQVEAHGSLASDFLSMSCQSQDNNAKKMLEPSKMPAQRVSNKSETWQESSTCTTRASWQETSTCTTLASNTIFEV